MTCIATMGTSSCATFAIQGFKDTDRALEEEYQKDPDNPKWDTPLKHPQCGSTFTHLNWWSKILYPTSQPLGRTGDYPFSKLMSVINDHRLGKKFCIVTINSYQQKQGFWPKLLKENDFELVDKTKNNIGGSVNYVYVRNPVRVEILDDEK